MAIDIIARGMIESSKNDISQLFDITKGGEIVNNESSYLIDNAADYPLLGLNLYGKSVQNGTPTPENPVDIVSVGDSGTVEITTCGKNLLKPLVGVTSQGITCVVENNSHVIINGTAKTTWSNITEANGTDIILGKKYTLSINKSLPFHVGIRLLDDGEERYIIPSGKTSATFEPKSHSKSILIYLSGLTSGAEYNENFYVQLELGETATDYEPYKGSTASITTALPLCGIPVDSGGNYTESTGQQWVCDELIYNADGTGKIVKHIGSYTISSNSDIHLMENTGVYRRFAIWGIPHKNMSMSAPCTAYKYQSGFEFNSDDIDSYANCFVLVNSTARFVSNATTVDEFIVANTGVKFTYPLAEPTETELSAAEISAFREMQTFDGVTNITNDSGADMDVKFCANKMLSKCVMPILSGLQAQIDELKAAVISLGGNV